METAHYEKKLRDKLTEIESEMGRLREEEHLSGDEQVRDSIDQADDAQQSSEAASEADIWSANEEDVRDALDRVAKGTYGKCVECGVSLPAARLEAVPWAAYCIADQERLEN